MMSDADVFRLSSQVHTVTPHRMQLLSRLPAGHDPCPPPWPLRCAALLNHTPDVTHRGCATCRPRQISRRDPLPGIHRYVRVRGTAR
jgi:hypothetical protein